MNRILLLIGLVFIIQKGEAQNSLDLGFASGVTNYFGDLGNDDFMQASSLRPGVAVTLRNFISPNPVTGRKYSVLNIEERISWHRIGYDETKSVEGRSGSELKNYGRGLNFRTDLFGASTHLSFTYYPNRHLPLYKQSIALFMYTGVGIYYGRPKADLFNGDIDIANRYYFWNDGTVRDAAESTGKGNVIEKDGKYETDLIKWHTEGEGASAEGGGKKLYSPWHLGIPIACGFRYGLNKAITCSIEFGYYKFLTDYLDDVSDRYATYAQIEQRYPNDPKSQQLAMYISDPTGKGTNGDDNSPATSRRGNPKLNDSYSFINMEIAYKINWNPKKLTSWIPRKGRSIAVE